MLVSGPEPAPGLTKRMLQMLRNVAILPKKTNSWFFELDQHQDATRIEHYKVGFVLRKNGSFRPNLDGIERVKKHGMPFEKLLNCFFGAIVVEESAKGSTDIGQCPALIHLNERYR